MFNTMKNLTLSTTLTTLALAGAVAATELPPISDIDVSASYDAAEDTNAQELFPEIADDVRLAIAALIPQSDNAADPIIRVDIRKVALDGDTIMPDSAEFNQLQGIVAIETRSGSGGQTFPVNITAMTDTDAVPAGFIAIPPSNDDFYSAMVDGFAINVAEGVERLNTDGGTINR